MNLKSAISITLANKVQKLLMLSSHHRLLLSKLVLIAPDLGLLPNFRSRLCNDYPDKFKIVDTSYGRALELVSCDQELAMILRHPELFYLSLKDVRNSVLLVECFNVKGVLLEKDETLVMKEKLMELSREGKRMRRERRKHSIYGSVIDQDDVGDDDEDDDEAEYDADGFEYSFDTEDSNPEYCFDDESIEIGDDGDNGEFWIADASSVNGQCIKPWL